MERRFFMPHEIYAATRTTQTMFERYFHLMKRLPTLPLIVPNTPISPRSRARCFADSPRRGEYGALAP